MSTQHSDGGPAFPVTVWRNVIGDSPLDPVQQASGMSLRDFFAAHALSGIVSEGHLRPLAAAVDAYDYADAMLRAREAK